MTYVYIRNIINILKERYSECTDQQKKSVIGIAVDGFKDSQQIAIPLKDNGIRALDSSEIIYINEPKKGLVFIHTHKEKIEFKSNAYDLLEYIERVNPSFRYLNRGLVVNMDKITSYHSYQRKVYFINDEAVDVTGAAMKSIIEKNIAKEKDLYNLTLNGNYEY